MSLEHLHSSRRELGVARLALCGLLASCANTSTGVDTVREQTNCTLTVGTIYSRDGTVPPGRGGGASGMSSHRPEVINVGKNETWLNVALAPSCQTWVRGRLSDADGGTNAGFSIPAQLRFAEGASVDASLRFQMVRNVGLTAAIGPVDLSQVPGQAVPFTGTRAITIELPTTDIPTLSTTLEYDQVAPVVSDFAVTATDRGVAVSFVASEPGVWALMIGTDTNPNIFHPAETAVCTVLPSTIPDYYQSSCAPGRHCILQGEDNLDVCNYHQLGGVVDIPGRHSQQLVLPTLPVGMYTSTLLYIDRGDNAARTLTTPLRIER